MFGNIKPDKNELKLRDYTNYRAYYCGLCKSMGGRYKGLCNMGLSYEAVFLALIISAVKDEYVTVKAKRCILHPFVKRPVAVESRSIDTAAAVNVMLMYYKLIDNVKDENSFSSRMAKLWFTKPYKRAGNSFPQIDVIIKDKLEDLSLAEESLCDALDMAAEPSSELLGCIMKNVLPEKQDDIYWFGFFIGKWLYVIDAYEDIEKDKKTGAYNPFIAADRNASSEEIRARSKDDCRFLLETSLDEIAKLYMKLDFKRNNALIENVIFSGMPKRTQEVLNGVKKKKVPEEYRMI